MFIKMFSTDNPEKQLDRASRNVVLANTITHKLVSIGVRNEKVLELGADLSDLVIDTEIIKGLTDDMINLSPDNSDAWFQTLSDLKGWSENLRAHHSHTIKAIDLLYDYSKKLPQNSK